MVGSIPFFSAFGWSGGGQLAPGAPAGYEIFIQTGDSNTMYGATLDLGVDTGDPRIYQLGVHAPNANAVIPGVDPLDTADTMAGHATSIGHDVHFLKDYYINNGLLAGGKSALIVAYGSAGTGVSGGWAASGGTAGNPTAVGQLVIDQTARIATALALTPGNTVKALLDCCGAAQMGGHPTLDLSLCNKYRWQLHREIQYWRNLIGATVPIIICRMPAPLIYEGYGNSTNGLIADNVMTSLPNLMPYVGVADTLVPSELGWTGGDYTHFSAEDQRTLAARYYTAYLQAQANVVAAVTWDTDAPITALGYASGFTLSNSNLDLSGDAGSGWKSARITSPLRTGKGYAEVKIQAMASGVDLGFLGYCNADKALSVSWMGSTHADDGPARMSAGIYGGSTMQNDVVGYTKTWAGVTLSWTTNDIIMFAVDMSLGRAWIGKNGTWMNSGDPVAGTGQWISGIVDPIFIGASIQSGTGNTYRLQPTRATFTYTPPTGFGPWGTGLTPTPISYSPADDATLVAVNATLAVTFSEAITLGASGTIYLKRSGDGITEQSWNVATAGGSTAGKVEVVGGTVLTMHLSGNMTDNVFYSVTWEAGVVQNGGAVPALPSASLLTWSFMTAPAAITPAAGPQEFVVPSQGIVATGSRAYTCGDVYFVEA